MVIFTLSLINLYTFKTYIFSTHEKPISANRLYFLPSSLLLNHIRVSSTSSGQIQPHSFQAIIRRKWLATNTVLALTQDHNGKIWAGTFDGLCWYDGYRFSSFYKDLNDSTSLSNNHVYSLCTDKEGTVWVGTLTGLSRYNIVGNNFTNYSLPGGLPIQILTIVDLSEKNQLLLGTNNGLVILTRRPGIWISIPICKAKLFILSVE